MDDKFLRSYASDDDLIRLIEENENLHRNGLHFDDMYIGSIYDAIQVLKNLDHSQREKRQQLIEHVFSKNLPSDQLTRTEFIHELANIPDYWAAYQACTYFLKQGFFEGSVFAEAIFLSGKLGLSKMTEAYIASVERIPTSVWSERLFSCCINALQSMALSNHPKTVYFRELAEKFAHDYIAYFPYNEEGHYFCARMHFLQNNRNEAVDVLRRAIFEVRPGYDSRRLVCPNCCLLLLVILERSADHDFIQTIAEKGLADSNGENGDCIYFAYRRARAMEAKLNSAQGKLDTSDINNVLNAYRFTLNLISEYTKTTHGVEVEGATYPVRSYDTIINQRIKIVTQIYLKQPHQKGDIQI